MVVMKSIPTAKLKTGEIIEVHLCSEIIVGEFIDYSANLNLLILKDNIENIVYVDVDKISSIKTKESIVFK